LPCSDEPCAFYDTKDGVLDSVDDNILDAKHMRKTKIVATIGPTSNSFEAICELGDKGMNVARLNMSHGDHASHKDVVEKIKMYNKRDRGCMAILLDTKVQPPRCREQA
jgi:pyruvate kinase